MTLAGLHPARAYQSRCRDLDDSSGFCGLRRNRFHLTVLNAGGASEAL